MNFYPDFAVKVENCIFIKELFGFQEKISVLRTQNVMGHHDQRGSREKLSARDDAELTAEL